MPFKPTEIFDVIGVGVGPFNLSLAALAEPIETLSCMFFESKPQFDWHPGLLMEDCTLQVPMMADLVTMADPTSHFSYLNYLHETNRLYHFYFYEDFLIPRQDYNLYCQWVSTQLSSLKFRSVVTNVSLVDGIYQVTVKNLANGDTENYQSKNIVIGTGTTPQWPGAAEALQHHHAASHSGDYLDHKSTIQRKKNLTVIGSGQSAGEIVLDLLNEQPEHGYSINWLTRSAGFLPMEYSKLGLEHFSPEYIDHFYSLNESKRDDIRSGQDLWYKGMSSFTISEIYNRIYRRSIGNKPHNITLQARSELIETQDTGEKLRLHFKHLEQEESFSFDTDHVIVATGHSHTLPACLNSLRDSIKVDKKNRPIISRNYQITFKDIHPSRLFIQNGEIHSHGIGAPDLGLGAYRSASIINQIANSPVYKLQKKNVFQNFGIAKKWRDSDISSPSNIKKTAHAY